MASRTAVGPRPSTPIRRGYRKIGPGGAAMVISECTTMKAARAEPTALLSLRIKIAAPGMVS